MSIDKYNEKAMPLEGEDFINYRYRITENKDKYNLTWEDIKILCLYFYDEKVSDNWRKFFYFNKEREEYNYDGCTRILALSDNHVPFHLPVATFEKYAGKTDVLVLNGDLIDCYSISKFTKMYRQPLINELLEARQFVIDLVKLIKPKKVIAIDGNHEIRLGRIVADKIGSDLMDIMPQSALAFLFDVGFRHYNHEEKSQVIYEPLTKVFEQDGIEVIYANDFWYKYGKTIFVHPLAFRQNPLATAVKAYEYFEGMGLSFDTVCMAHTHRIGYSRYNNKHLFEQGACANVNKMKYMDLKLPKITQQEGYIYIVQDRDGNLAYDKTKLEILN